MASKVLPPNSSGIKVIVVGLGYAGVVAAVECYRKGHEVLVYEQTNKVSEGGESRLDFVDERISYPVVTRGFPSITND